MSKFVKSLCLIQYLNVWALFFYGGWQATRNGKWAEGTYYTACSLTLYMITFYPPRIPRYKVPKEQRPSYRYVGTTTSRSVGNPHPTEAPASPVSQERGEP